MKIFVLSLLRALDRRHDAELKLRSIGLEFEFHDSIDGQEFSHNELEDLKENMPAYQSTKRPLSNEEIACWLGHKEIWKKISARKDDFAMVLEDDFFFTQPPLEFLKKLDTLSSNSKRNLFLKIDRLCKQGQEIGRIGGFQLHISNNASPRTMGYILGSSAAKELLDSFQQFTLPIDNSLKRFWEYETPLISLAPPLITVNAHRFLSHIESGRKNARKSHKITLGAKLWNIFRVQKERWFRRNRLKKHQSLIELRDELKALNHEN